MAKKLIDILSDAAVVRDETNEKANTAERVGGVLVELANYLSAFAPVSDVTVEADGANVRLVLHIKNEDGTVSTRRVTLPAASTSSAGVLTSELLKALQAADRANEDLAQEGISKAESASAMLFAEEAERKAADAELLKRIIGKSTASSAYNDPFRYLTDYQSEKDASGTITKHAIRVMQDALLDTLRHSDYRESFPYIGHMRAHIEGVPIEMWTYVKAWNTGSTNGVFVQVVRTNFGLKGGVISSALTSEFHEYHREVTVAMSNGNVTDVTATAWKERTADIRDMADEGLSKADAALSQIHEERQERSSQDRALAEAVSNERAARTAADAELQAADKANEDLAKEGISKAESARAMLFTEEAERKAADAELSTSISAEEAARTQRDAELTAALTTETNTRLTADRAEKEARETADNELSERITSEAAAREASDAELQAKIQDHEDRIWKLENQWYGIEWDTEVSSPAVTRIGNMDLHRTLPIQSRMRGCLLNDNGEVVEYLNEKYWTGHDLSGARGQVMVEIPMHYRKFETNGTKRVVRLSEHPLPGYHQVPQMYVSAYEATLQRSTNKLCSVVNTDPDFRGGNNNAAWDGTYRSLLGRPVTAINRPKFRTYARNRNNAATSEWNIYTYHVHKALYWLYVVEYANRNSQLPFTEELTAEGFRQGGLGKGVSDWQYPDLKAFNSGYPFVPCGYTDSIGNATGVVAYTTYNADGSELKTSYVPRYRGIENPFGHISKLTDGINVRISPTEENGGDNLSKVFESEDPYQYNDTNYNGYKFVGNEARTNGYIKDIIFGEDGEIIPSLVGGDSTQFFCDYHYTNIPTTEALLCVLFGGAAYENAVCGLAGANSRLTPSTTQTLNGSRLCFLPAE